MRPLNIIVAVDERGGFGKEGKIPWNFPEDLEHFKTITNKGACIMGRRTYEDIVEMKKNKNFKKVLSGRDSYVVTSTLEETKGATGVKSIREVFDNYVDEHQEVFVIGGSRLFIESIVWAKKVYMTIIKGNYECDRFFPIKYLSQNFTITAGEELDKAYFVEYER